MRVVNENAAGKTARDIVTLTGRCLGELGGMGVRLSYTAM